MKLFISIFIVCNVVSLSAQISASERVIDYGEIRPGSGLEKEVYFINTGAKEALLLTNDFPREYSAHISSKKVSPGDTVFLRWKFNPLHKGGFNDKISLWFSTMDEPNVIKIKGNVQYIDPYANPACPNFNERPAGQERTFLTDFVVLDKASREPIKNAKVKVVDRGLIMVDLEMDRNGEKSVKLPIRYYYFSVEAEGYEPSDLYSYINSKNHRFVFDLHPLEVSQPIEEKEEIDEDIVKVEESAEVEEIEINMEVEEIEELEEFSLKEYAPNNLVFLVDVSGSMNNNGRLEILKSSMIEMVNMMRAEDKIALVSYARNANVLLAPTSGANKEQIIREIRSLSPQGSTSGEKGLKQAYATAKSGFISGGNNRVYIATDGVFKVSENEAIYKAVRKNTNRKIYLSVLGIKGTTFTKKKMAELAKEGKGAFIDMEDFDSSAEKLKELVKSQSKKK